jgi:hypothetical protein
MDSNEEDSKNYYDESSANFPLMNIYNKIQLLTRDSSNNLVLKENNYMYICGKMFSHTSLAKYSFEACEFYLYSPSDNRLYHSLMNSEDCFSNALKWNIKLFKNIRDCLTKEEINIKKYYFIVNSNMNKENSSKEKEEIIFENNKTYLELHFMVKKRDIVAFRLLLEEIIQNDNDLFFMNQVILIDNECEEELMEKKKKKYKQDLELNEIQNYIKGINDNYEKKTKEILIKFNKLNKSKIEEEEKLKIKLEQSQK